MYKAIKDNKIIAINEVNSFPCLVKDSVVEDTEHTCADYGQYNGEFILITDIPGPSIQEQIEELEKQITPRNLRSAIQGDEFAINKIASIEAQIAELRRQLLESDGE